MKLHENPNQMNCKKKNKQFNIELFHKMLRDGRIIHNYGHGGSGITVFQVS